MKRLLILGLASVSCALADTPVVTNIAPISVFFSNSTSINFRWYFGSVAHPPQKSYRVFVISQWSATTNYDSGVISSSSTQHVATLSQTPDGFYDWKVVVTDQNDDVAESAPTSFALDRTCPDNPWFNTPQYTYLSSPTQLLDIDFYDNVQLNFIQYSIDGYPLFFTLVTNFNAARFTNDWSLSAGWNSIPDGLHYLTFWITDWAGLTNKSSSLFWFTKDTTPPESPTFNTPEQQWFQSSPTLDIDFSDNIWLDRVEYRVDASTNWVVLASNLTTYSFTSNWKPDAVWPALSNGVHFLYFRITDRAGWTYVTPDGVSAFEFRKGAPPPDQPWPETAFFRIVAPTNSRITRLEGTNLTFLANGPVGSYEVEMADALNAGTTGWTLLQRGSSSTASNVVRLRLGQANLYRGMEAYYPMIGNGRDRSGHGRDATVMGATFEPSIFSVQDQACRFDGQDDRLQVADDPALRLGQGDFTLAAWVYQAQRSTGATHTLLCKRGGGNTNGWYWGITGDTSPLGAGKVVFMMSSDADPRLASTGVIGLSNWTHVAVTYQAASQTARVFLNGTLDNVATGLPNPSSLTTNALQIGGTTEADPAALRGSLDEVRIYRRALSSDEIWQLYCHIP